jgi:hypothetical protein
MKSIGRFCKYAGLSAVIQFLIWFTPGRWAGAFLEKLIYLYYPTIWIVERCRNLTGESKLTEPILIGVPLGIIAYSIILASILIYIQKSRRT